MYVKAQSRSAWRTKITDRRSTVLTPGFIVNYFRIACELGVVGSIDSID